MRSPCRSNLIRRIRRDVCTFSVRSTLPVSASQICNVPADQQHPPTRIHTFTAPLPSPAANTFVCIGWKLTPLVILAPAMLIVCTSTGFSLSAAEIRYTKMPLDRVPATSTVAASLNARSKTPDCAEILAVSRHLFSLGSGCRLNSASVLL
eukprot:TRINITY_DN2523_c0_g1_i14.p2 TRINITY_DN2523_c0_g1~~TRINITY_DN2523_c0_g1_i14.p2  ORF type:complete len:151 (+),score=25.90 TRINITY_DN2523_c0_g1_i14:621-1073(+)